MEPAFTYAFALVAIVAFVVALGSLMLAVRCNSRTTKISMEWQTSRPQKLAAEVDALADNLAAHRRAVRAELGRMWAKSGARQRDDDDDDDELPAEFHDLLRSPKVGMGPMPNGGA